MVASEEERKPTTSLPSQALNIPQRLLKKLYLIPRRKINNLKRRLHSTRIPPNPLIQNIQNPQPLDLQPPNPKPKDNRSHIRRQPRERPDPVSIALALPLPLSLQFTTALPLSMPFSTAVPLPLPFTPPFSSFLFEAMRIIEHFDYKTETTLCLSTLSTT